MAAVLQMVAATPEDAASTEVALAVAISVGCTNLAVANLRNWTTPNNGFFECNLSLPTVMNLMKRFTNSTQQKPGAA